jgi:hypothetical protein
LKPKCESSLFFLVSPNEKGCCHWSNGSCFIGSGGRAWSEVGLWVLCGKSNNVPTKVNLPAGGYLNIKKSESGQDNFIDVYGHLNDLKYWYRCGVDESRVNY